MPLSTPATTTPPASPRRLAGAAARYQQDGTRVVSPNRLVVLLYERLLKDLDAAAALLEVGEGAHEPLVHAQDIVDALDLALDTSQWSGGIGLRSIYEHLHRELVTANLERDIVRVRECRALVEPLAEAWSIAAAGGADE